MSDKMNLEDVFYKVEDEGLGYMVQHYMSGDSIDDPKLAAMWDECKAMLNAITEYLEDNVELDQE